MRRVLLAMVLLCAAAPAPKPSSTKPPAPNPPLGDDAACAAAIVDVQRASGTPPGLLRAISLAESGRLVGNHVVAWPWTIDVGGNGQFFARKADAIAAVAALQAAGTQSIDVGCMQVNLMHHPGAFATLDDAFDPRANAAYAARFLTDLFRMTQTWPAATAGYHSLTPDIGQPYQLRVAALWPEGAQYGALPAVVANGPLIDPYHVYTTAFAQRLEMDAANRALRNAHLRAAPARGGVRSRMARLLAYARAEHRAGARLSPPDL